MNVVYGKTNINEYHGGYPIYSSCEKKYLGGNDEIIVSRYNNMVVPFGLYYRPSNNHLEYDNHQDEDEDEMTRETKCIDPELFDKLLDAVKIEVTKKRKHNNKTKKHKKHK